jgi:hypothetical protein
VLNLSFVSAAIADNGFLDMAGRILKDRQLRLECGAECGRSSLAELKGAIGVSMHEYALDRNLGGLMASDKRTDLDKDLSEPAAVVARCSDYPAVDQIRLATADVDETVTRDPGAGVDS